MLNEFSKNILANQIWQPEKYQWDLSPREDTVLLCHFDDKQYIDSSIYNNTITFPNSIGFDEDQPKFGKGDFKANGADVLTVELTNSNWKFGDTDFTIDFWIKKGSSWSASYNSLGYIWGLKGDWGSYFESRCVANYNDGTGQLQLYGRNKFINETQDYNLTTLPDDTNWHHIAYVWDKNTTYFSVFYDGKQVYGYFPCDFNYYDASKLSSFYIGGHYEGYYIRSFGGYLDEFRICKRKVWEKDFILPTKQYTLV